MSESLLSPHQSVVLRKKDAEFLRRFDEIVNGYLATCLLARAEMDKQMVKDFLNSQKELVCEDLKELYEEMEHRLSSEMKSRFEGLLDDFYFKTSCA